MSWIHNAVATHSPILGVTSSDPDSGKSTLLAFSSCWYQNPSVARSLPGPPPFAN